MATAAPTEEDLSENWDTDDSMTKMSEEANEMYCEHCEKEMGTNVIATGFCVDCVEYLCPTCIRYHKKYVPEHTQQGSSHMPQDFCYDKCPLHPREIIKFYCESCKEAVCPNCKREKHKDCSSVCHIPSKVQTTGLKDELEQVTQLIDETLEGLSVKQEKVNSDLTEVHSSRKEATMAIGRHKETLEGQVQNQHKQLLDELERNQERLLKEHDQRRAEIIAKLDQERAELHHKMSLRIEQLERQQEQMLENIHKTEQNLDKESKQMNQTDVIKLQVVISKTNKMENEVKEIKQSIEEKIKAREKCKLFLALKTANQSLTDIKTDIEKVDDDADVSFYEFQACKDTIDLEAFQYNISFGKLLDKSEVIRRVKYVCSIKVTSETDIRNSHVTGICKYSDYLVVADNSNKSIIYMDTKQENKLSYFSQLQEEPFDVTCVDGDEVAVTLPGSGKIQFVSITEEGMLSMSNEIGVGKSCHGIEYKKPNLIVTFLNPPEVQILSATGVIIRRFSNFSCPKYVRVGHSNKIFYIQDTTNTYFTVVKKVTYDGKIVNICSQPTRQPGLAIDHFGSVFLGYSIGHLFCLQQLRLIQLSANLKFITVIGRTQHKRGLTSCLFYCNKEHKLYVATSTGRIHVFKLT